MIFQHHLHSYIKKRVPDVNINGNAQYNMTAKEKTVTGIIGHHEISFLHYVAMLIPILVGDYFRY